MPVFDVSCMPDVKTVGGSLGECSWYNEVECMCVCVLPIDIACRRKRGLGRPVEVVHQVPKERQLHFIQALRAPFILGCLQWSTMPSLSNFKALTWRHVSAKASVGRRNIKQIAAARCRSCISSHVFERMTNDWLHVTIVLYSTPVGHL